MLTRGTSLLSLLARRLRRQGRRGADRELLTDLAIGEFDGVFGVAVDANEAGDLDCDARLLHDLALHGLCKPFALLRSPPGRAYGSSMRRTSRMLSDLRTVAAVVHSPLGSKPDHSLYLVVWLASSTLVGYSEVESKWKDRQ